MYRGGCRCFFRARKRDAIKSAKAQRKKSAKRSESAERERKKAQICAFSSLPHWKPGSRAQSCSAWGKAKEYEILRSPGRGASLLKTGQVSNYCVMRGICLLIRAISPTFLPLFPGHSSTTPT